jgi:inorganic pyrophosphatase
MSSRYKNIYPLTKDNMANAIIEIPMGDIQKYEYNEDLDIYVLDRTLPSTMPYPMSYGFFPNTRGGDGDCLDVCIYSRFPIARDTMVEVKVITALELIDNGKMDYKYIGVPTSNPNLSKYNSVEDLDQLVLNHTKNFFSLYKSKQKNSDVVVKDWISYEKAMDILAESSF